MLRLIAMTAAVFLLDGCGASTYRVHTDHFLAFYDREWKIARERQGRVAGIRFKRDNDDLEVRVFGWLARHEIKTPNAEAMGRLWDEASVELRTHRPAAQVVATCNAGATLKMFGEERPVVALASEKWRTFIVTAQAEGSLVAVVARRPVDQVSTCFDEVKLAETVQELLVGLQPSMDAQPRSVEMRPTPTERVPHFPAPPLSLPSP